MVKTSPSNAGGEGSIPVWGAKIPHASWPKNRNIKQKQYCNKFITIIQKETYTTMFIAALFTIARTWKQPKCPLMDEWIK